MKKKKSKGRIKERMGRVSSAFWKKDSLYCILTDIALLFILAMIILISIAVVGKMLEGFVDIAPRLLEIKQQVLGNELSANVRAEVEGISRQLEDMKISISSYAIFIFLLTASIASVFKGFIWSRISRKCFSWQYVWKFAALTICLLCACIVVMILTVVLTKTPINAYLLVIELALIHFVLMVAYVFFDPDKTLWVNMRSVREVFSLRSLLNYLLVLVWLVLLCNIVLLGIAVSAVIMFIPSLLVFLAGIHASRIYFYISLRTK
ncbi:hypothetical protein ACFL3V_01975 [Nanoarchaeota archaeon]